MIVLKANKFKVGDKVKVVSHNNTVKRFGGDSDDLAEIGTEVVVNNVIDMCVGIEGDMFLLDVDDVILLDEVEIANDINIGDYVKFLGSSNDSTWKTEYGLNVGDIVTVINLDDDFVLVRTKTNAYIWVYLPQVSKCIPESDTTQDEINTTQDESIKKTLYSPLTVQHAGDHYKKKGIQPVEYGLANNLSFPQVNVVKYITRHEDKNGLDDLAKSIHYHFFEALRVYGENGTHELRNKVLSLLGIDQGVIK